MPSNIKEIRLWTDNPNRRSNDGMQLVKIEFNFPCTWTVLHVTDLEQILRLWIRGEQQKLDGKYKDAFWLKELINRVFEEECQ